MMNNDRMSIFNLYSVYKEGKNSDNVYCSMLDLWYNY